METNKGNLLIYIDGDCCSTGYIDHLGLDLPIRNNQGSYEIKEFIEIEMPQVELANTVQDSDILYGLKIKLKEGQIFIEYRNSSNGYYGSSHEYSEIESLNGFVKIENSF